MSISTKLLYAFAFCAGAASLHLPIFQPVSIRDSGMILAVQQSVTGDTDLYSLVVPDENWVRVDKGTIIEDADLELVGPNQFILAYVYVYCERSSLDDQVATRQEEIKEFGRDPTVFESRSLLSGSAVPVSHAVYEWHDEDTGFDQSMVVATVTKADFMVEVVGFLTDDGFDRKPLEKLVKSLRLKLGVTACQST
jgi:hypothetical protein